MEITEIKAILNDVYASIDDWCLLNSNDNMSYSNMKSGCNYVISEIGKKIDNLDKTQKCK